MQLSKSRRYIELSIPLRTIEKPIELEGITYDQNAVRFDSGIWSIDQAAIVSAALSGLSASISLASAGSSRKEFKAGKSELDLINSRHAETPLELDDLYIYQRMPVNNVMSRTIGIKFTDAALDKFALDAQAGRARLRSHNRSDIVGRVFDAEVVTDTVRGIEGKWLRTTEYIPKRTLSGEPMNAELLTQVGAGVYSSDSIGFNPGSKIEFKDLEVGGKMYSVILIDYDAGEQAPLELREISFVHLGEIKGAGSRKALHDGAEEFSGVYFNQSGLVEVSGHKRSARWEISV